MLLAGATDGEKALLQAAVKSGQSAGLDPLLASLDQRMRSNLGGIVASVLEDSRGKVSTLQETAFESWSTARAATTGAARVTANSEASTAAAATIPPVDTFAAAQGFDKVCAAVSRIQFTREKGEGGTLKVKRTDFLDAVTAGEDALGSSVVPTPTLTLLRTAIKDASAASALLERHAKKALSQPPLLSLNINQIDDLVGGLSARQKITDWRAVLLKPHGEGSGGGVVGEVAVVVAVAVVVLPTVVGVVAAVVLVPVVVPPTVVVVSVAVAVTVLLPTVVGAAVVPEAVSVPGKKKRGRSPQP